MPAGLTKDVIVRMWAGSLPKDREFAISEALDHWSNNAVYWDRRLAIRALNRDGRFVQVATHSTYSDADTTFIRLDAVKLCPGVAEQLAARPNPCGKCSKRKGCALKCADRRRYDLIQAVI